MNLHSSRSLETTPVLPDLETSVVIVGGGIAGAWAALRLAQRGVPAVLITYQATDRGGVQGATVKSVGAINTSPSVDPEFEKKLKAMCHQQSNASIGCLMQERLAGELADLNEFSDLEQIKIGVKLSKGNARQLLAKLYAKFEELGGTMRNGWVTRIVADKYHCQGVQYQTPEGIGKVRAQSLVIASGGYAGLFEGSVQTACYGTMLGQTMQAGGAAVNLEFLFKHGFGKPDMGQLTPTEQMLGAVIMDEDGNHVEWLEREIFEGRATESHHRAVRFWRSNHGKKFFVSLRFRSLFDRIVAVNQCAKNGGSLRSAIASLIAGFDPEQRADVRRQTFDALRQDQCLSYDFYARLRRLWPCDLAADKPARLRQIAYFTMGGLAHREFETNLHNVYVSGEAMHDFGASRVGGLPWGLYLVAGSVIADRIAESRSLESSPIDFALTEEKAEFDTDLLQQIRQLLLEHQEQAFTAESAKAAITTVQGLRRQLTQASGSQLNDGVSWLIVAESILTASMLRKESRGCFMRDDYTAEDAKYDDLVSYCHYDQASDSVIGQLVPQVDLQRFLAEQKIQEPTQQVVS